MGITPGLARDLAAGDANYLSLVDAAFARLRGARRPRPARGAGGLRLDLRGSGIIAIIWATGFAFDFGWLQVGALDARGAPMHRRGITEVPGL